MELKSVSQGNNINLAGRKVILGRGPQLKIKDMRVSRKHALLRKKSDGHTYITPLQSNRCYVRRRGEKKRGLVVKEERRLKVSEEFGLLPYNFYFSICRKSKSRSKGSGNQQPAPRSKSRSAPVLFVSSTESTSSLKSILKKTPSNYELSRRQRRLMRQQRRDSDVKRVTICEEANVLTTQRCIDTKLSHKLKSYIDLLRSRRSGSRAKRSASTENRRSSKQRLVQRLKPRSKTRAASPVFDSSDSEDEDDVTYYVATRQRVKRLPRSRSVRHVTKNRKTSRSSSRARKSPSRLRR